MKRNTNFEKLKPINSSESTGQKIFYDGINEKGSWSHDTWPYSGLTIKWGHNFVEIQSYTYQCWLICGKWTYIDSSQVLSIKIDDNNYTI